MARSLAIRFITGRGANEAGFQGDQSIAISLRGLKALLKDLGKIIKNQFISQGRRYARLTPAWKAGIRSQAANFLIKWRGIK